MVVPPATWHMEFDRVLYGSLGTGARKVVIAPRGFAKSTKLSLCTPLICLARELRMFQVLVQDTSAQARQALSQVIHELDFNALLLQDFPGLRRAMINGRPVADRDTDVALANGCRIQSLGALGSLRGRRNRQSRVDLVLGDDLDNSEHVRSKFQRDKLSEWINADLMGSLAPNADVYICGTLLHFDLSLARLARHGAPWQSYTYHALTTPDDLGSSTWPEWWSKARLEEAKRTMGSAIWNREMLHQPVDPETAMFSRSDFQYRQNRQRLLEGGDVPNVKLRIAIDPAVSEKTTSDYSAIAVVARIGQSPEVDVLDVWRGRLSAKRLVERVKAEADRWARYRPIVISESVAMSAWLGQLLRDEGLSVRESTPRVDKQTRAASLGVKYENGQVFHDEALRDGVFEGELEQFPASPNDDQVDAVVMAEADLASAPTPRVSVLGLPGWRERLEAEIAAGR